VWLARHTEHAIFDINSHPNIHLSLTQWYCTQLADMYCRIIT
jgi:hypothetical protein